MGNSFGRRYRYGASFVDRASGVRFEGHHPLERPDLWKIYLDGAEGEYRNHGFEGSLRRQQLEDGTGVSLFYLGFAPDGRAVAGVRYHGPLEASHQAAVLEEMEASPEIDEIESAIAKEIRLGALEVKGAWSQGEATLGHRMWIAISRTVHHSMNWLGAEFAIAAVSDLWLPIGPICGATQIGVTAVPYPDERYRTIAVSWHRSRSLETTPPDYRQDVRIEAEQLSRGPLHLGPISVGPDSTWTRAYRPMVLDVSSRVQREVLRVLREDPSLQVLDRLSEQREQLAEMKPPPTSAHLEEAQRWVCYPWRRAVVRLLGPRAFAALRLDRNRNKLTSAEQARLRTLRIGVVGLSSGHSIAHLLAMEGLVGELRLADFDTIGLSNLNRIPGSVLDIGINKAIVAARRISEIDPYLRVIVNTEGITQDNLGEFLDGLDLVIEQCDSLDTKFLVREEARARRIPVLMETTDRGVLDVERFDLEPNRPLFHGILGDLDATDLANLPIEQKTPYLIRMIGPRDGSSRGAASLFEVGQTITGWPQLGSEVTLGAATAAAAVRRFGLDGDLPSGRVRFDMEEVLAGIRPVEVDTSAEEDQRAPLPDDPPPDGDDPIELIVDAARRAPSGGNVQPWRFEADPREIRFYMVPERSSTMDVKYRGSFVALGAALFNARVAAASLKSLGPVQLFPEGRHSHHVATMQLGSDSDPQIAPLNPRVRTRATNRRMGQPEEIDQSVLQLLSKGVEREGARLRFLTDRDQIAECSSLLAASDRLRFLSPKVHDEMVSELKFPGQDSVEEGIDIRTLEMDPTGIALLEIIRRPEVMAHLAEWRAGNALGLRTQVMVQSSSALALVTVPRPDSVSYVRGGAAVERFWLTAEHHGLALQPWAPLFLYAQDDRDLVSLVGERHLEEIFELQKRFSELWSLEEGETMALNFRVLHAPPPTVPSARLPLAHVLSRGPSFASSTVASNGHSS